MLALPLLSTLGDWGVGVGGGGLFAGLAGGVCLVGCDDVAGLGAEVHCGALLDAVEQLLCRVGVRCSFVLSCCAFSRSAVLGLPVMVVLVVMVGGYLRCGTFRFGGFLELFGFSLQRCLRFRLGWGGDVSWVVEAVRCVALDLYRVLDLSAAECVFSVVSGWVLYGYDAVVVAQAFFVVVYDGDGEDELEVSAEEYDRGVVVYRFSIQLLLVLLLEHPGWVLVQVRLEGFDAAEGFHHEVLRPSCKPEDRSQITSTSYRGRFTSQLTRCTADRVGARRVTAILGRKDHVESLLAILDRHRTVTSKTPDSFRFIVVSPPRRLRRAALSSRPNMQRAFELSRTASSSVSRGNDRKSGEAPSGTRSALSSSAALISIVINDVAVRPAVLS